MVKKIGHQWHIMGYIIYIHVILVYWMNDILMASELKSYVDIKTKQKVNRNFFYTHNPHNPSL